MPHNADASVMEAAGLPSEMVALLALTVLSLAQELCTIQLRQSEHLFVPLLMLACTGMIATGPLQSFACLTSSTQHQT